MERFLQSPISTVKRQSKETETSCGETVIFVKSRGLFMQLLAQFKFNKSILGYLSGIFLAASVATATATATGVRTATKLRPFSEPLPEDNFMVFLENLSAVTNINQLHAQGLTKGKSVIEPWANSYWPIHQGLLANRFSDSNFPGSKVFIKNYEYFQSRPPEAMIASGEINHLSPAEKYDLLVGDTKWTLTHAMWQRGLTNLADDGGVATWTGICHGWAGATHMGVKQPQNAIHVTDVTGSYSILFYPDDVAALLSFLWADSSPASLKAGNRCKQDQVVKDPHNRPLDPACLDSNPMSWHLAITNRVGLYGKSFVMDASAGPQVWNYPIASYNYSYFNPRTFESSHSLQASIVPLSYILNDKYSQSRSAKTKYLVGITMDVYHPALISPITGSPKGNTIHSESYAYDLELDEAYNIVGGEWYSHDRPDFIWTFHEDAKATNREDAAITEVWDGVTALPLSYSENAIKASQRGRVLSKIAEVLQNKSL